MVLGLRERLRFTFLGRFVLVTFILYAVVATSLALFLIDRHDAAVENNEAVNAGGQIGAVATDTLDHISPKGPLSAQTTIRLQRLADYAKRQEYVDDLRIYRADGQAIYPAGAAPDVASVLQTVRAGELWFLNRTSPRGEAIRTEYFPFATAATLFVIEVDFSRDAMRGQAKEEGRSVMLATFFAIGMVLVALVALAAGASREIERRRRESETTFVTTLGVLADTIDRRDSYTAGHSRRVAYYARLLAAKIGLSKREQDVIENAGLLHDLGKIGIPDAILYKPGKLDDSERAIMNSHPTIGSEIIAGVATMEDLVPCVLHHHERLDGSGYPQRLKGSEIPRGSLVIAVADTFDAITTDRPYRRAKSAADAVAEMRRVAGTQLQPEYVEAFAELVDSGTISIATLAPSLAGAAS